VTTSFDQAVAVILRLEGGPSNDPDDAGKRTKFGISERAHPDVDIDALTRERAIEIYRSHYWSPVRGDQLPLPLAFVLFDAAVNQGPDIAARLLQQVLRVEVDGVIGAETVAAARRAGAETVIAFLERRLARYEEIVVRRPVQLKYLKGWRQRVLRIHREAVKLEPAAESKHENGGSQ